MKKMIAAALFLAMALIMVPDARAHHDEFYAPRNILNVSFNVFRPSSLGYKHRVGERLYVTGALEYKASDDDLAVQGGAAYFFPVKILFFRPYGGGGLEYSRNLEAVYPYVTAGMSFGIFFTEFNHPLYREASSRFRFGLGIKF